MKRLFGNAVGFVVALAIGIAFVACVEQMVTFHQSVRRHVEKVRGAGSEIYANGRIHTILPYTQAASSNSSATPLTCRCAETLRWPSRPTAPETEPSTIWKVVHGDQHWHTLDISRSSNQHIKFFTHPECLGVSTRYDRLEEVLNPRRESQREQRIEDDDCWDKTTCD